MTTSDTTTKERVVLTGSEREFLINELFFSTTDKRGVVTSGNSVFARVSGYTFDELLGKPHNIIRHPDMPRCVFELLWDFIGTGQSIIAFVKNLAKDGAYYWVVAYVVPVENGYLSVRFKPSSAILGIVQGLYKKLLQVEIDHGTRGEARKAGMKASRAALTQALSELGFPDYTSFMHAALIAELKSRDSLLAGMASDSAPNATRDSLQRAFAQLDKLQMMQDGFAEKSKFVRGVSGDMKRFALNANVEAAKLGEHGKTLGVLAGFLGEGATNLRRDVDDLNGTISKLMPQVRCLMYDIAGAKLLNEMKEKFREEMALDETDMNHSILAGKYPEQASEVRINLLESVFQETFRRISTLLSDVSMGLRRLDASASTLSKTGRELGFAHVTGRVEVSQLSQASSFSIILQHIKDSIEKTQLELRTLSHECTEASHVLSETVREFSRINPQNAGLRASL